VRKLIDKLAAILLEPVNEVVTVFLGIYTVLWGLWVLNPLVDTFTTAKLYSALMAFLPNEILWGSIAVFFGLMTMVALAKRMPKNLFYGSAASALHWGVISIFYFIGDTANTGGITALFLAVLSTYIYLNHKVNYTKDQDDAGIS